MDMKIRADRLCLVVALWVAPAVAYGQFDFKLGNRAVQIHSFGQQGFAYSNDNNFLTMNTSKGSFAMTDGGINASMPVTDKFRVGAQLYARNIGDLGRYRVQLDWAYGDYKFKEWLGVRAGKVKTALGLLNDTQDAEFLHTWAILPQSVYPLDLRSNTIAHTGADLYGQLSLRKAGSLSYTGYIGARVNDKRGGLYFVAADGGYPVTSYSGVASGVDLRWNTPLAGLMLGGSWSDQTVKEVIQSIAITVSNDPQRLSAFYGDYTHDRWHLSGEYRKNRQIIRAESPRPTSISDYGDRSMFVAIAFRATKHLELGTYNSRYLVDVPKDTRVGADHIFDQAITARFDITKWWNLKVEGHFMNGFGDTYSAHGFYRRNNPNPTPSTSMFVVRTGFYL